MIQKIMISNKTIMDMNGYGLNIVEKLVLVDKVLPKLKEKRFHFYNNIIKDCQEFIGKDLSPLREFMENYKHGRPNSNLPLILGDSALK